MSSDGKGVIIPFPNRRHVDGGDLPERQPGTETPLEVVARLRGDLRGGRPLAWAPPGAATGEDQGVAPILAAA